MSKDIHFETIPEMTGKLSQKHSKVAFRRGVSGEVHTYIYHPEKPVERSTHQQHNSQTFKQRLAAAKAIMDDPIQRAEWQQRFDTARFNHTTPYHRLQQFIAFTISESNN